MNDDRNYQENKEAILELLKMGMSAKIIEDYFEISSSTVYNYVQRLQNNHEFTDAVQTTVYALPRILGLLTYLKIGHPNQAWITLTKIDEKKLEIVLDKVLETEKILNIVEHAYRPLLKLLRFGFVPDFPSGYQDLLNYLNPGIERSDNLTQKIWLNYLKDLAKGTISLHYFPTLHVWQEATINYLLDQSDILIRPYILPILPLEIVDKIQNVFFPTLRPEEVELLRMYFGIDFERINLSQIAARKGLSAQRLNQKFHATIRRAKSPHRLNSILAVPLTWEKVIALIPAKANNNSKPLPPTEALKLLIVDLNLSTRAQNCLRPIEGITYLGDLSNFYVEDLYKYRNMGTKTINEIKAVMKKYGVPFRKHK